MAIDRDCRLGCEDYDNFLLNRFLDEIPIPTCTMDEASGPETPRVQSLTTAAPNETETHNVTDTPTTPQRTVSGPTLLPSSPISVRSGRGGRSITYKEPDFLSQLEVRGIVETDESPLLWNKIIQLLKKKPLGLQPLDGKTIEAFNCCLEAPGNEPSIQGVIVVTLVKLHDIIRSPTTQGGLQCQFRAENALPVLQGNAQSALRLAVPWPDVVIGFRRSSFQEYIGRLVDLGTIAAPIICTQDIIFPCFSVEVKGDSSIIHTRSQNRNNAAHMLRNLRLLCCQARNEAHTEKHFDNRVWVITATVTRTTVSFSGHWTLNKKGQIYTHSKRIKSVNIDRISDKEWNDLYAVFHNLISYIVDSTGTLVRDKLQCLEAGEPAPKRRRT